MESMIFSETEIKEIRSSFPFFTNNPNFIYFNSAATSLKPQTVINRLVEYYQEYGLNSSRGLCPLSEKLHIQLRKTRKDIANFIGANHETNIVFTHSTTVALNTIAKVYGASQLCSQDIIYTLATEHSSSILPWVQVAQAKGVIIEKIPLNNLWEIDYQKLSELLSKRVKFIIISQMSNTTGVLHDLKKVVGMARPLGIQVVVDGAQSINHTVVDVEAMGIDFFVFSGHKMFGTGSCGVLYIRDTLINQVQPLIDGGGTHHRFDLEGAISYLSPPFHLEAGTLPWGDILSLSEAVAFWEKWGRTRIHHYIHELTTFGVRQLQVIEKVIIYNHWVQNGIILCNVKGIDAQDVEQYLGKYHISVRSGAHCNSLTKELFPSSTLRISFHVYNTKEEIVFLASLLEKVTLEECLSEVINV